jgi:polysulfide reductase chain C
MGKTEPWRIIYLFTNIESVMTWGIWILVFFIPIAFLYGFLEFVDAEPFVQGLLSSRLPKITPFLNGLLWNRLPRLRPKAGRYRRWVAIIGSVFAVATAAYTGLLLSAVGEAIPLWGQPLLPFTAIPIIPILFLVSAVSTGVALTVDLAATIALPDGLENSEPMPLIHVVLVSLELVLVGLLFISALGSGGAAAESARLVLFGPLSVIFWVGVVLIGLVFPFAVYLYNLGSNRHPWLLAVSTGTCVILAGLFLRYLIITAGIPAVM